MKPARAREPHLRSSRRAQPPREKVAAPSCDLQAELATFPRTDPSSFEDRLADRLDTPARLSGKEGTA